MDYGAVRSFIEQQYGRVTIWSIKEKEILQLKESGRSDQNKDDGIGGLLLLVVFGPFLVMLCGPAFLTYSLLASKGIHSGIILLSVLGSFALTGLTLYLIFAFVPQSLIVIAGFALYGLIGYSLGSDQIWKLIIGGALGLVGAAASYYIGDLAKSDPDGG